MIHNGNPMPPTYRRKAKLDHGIAAESPENHLPKLTLKQQRFVKYILQGKTSKEAYRLAFNSNTKNESSVSAQASRLASDVKIASYLRYYQRIGLEEASITRENHLSELARLRELAVENQQVSAGVQAEHYRGRVAGLYNDKLSLTIGPSDEVLLGQLSKMLGESTVNLIEQALTPDDSDILALPSPLEKSIDNPET
jgi:hypothetical protein